MAKNTLNVTLLKSLNGRLRAHKACAKGLGLRRISQSIDVEDTAENRGMINAISYMLEVRES